MQVGESEMVKSLKETDLPEPWFGNKSKAPTAPKRTRETQKPMQAHPALEAKAEGQGMKKGKGRGKGKNKENAGEKGKNNVTYERTGPAGVAAGRTKNPVPDPQELRRKRIEDALACGRVVKTILHPGKRRSSTKIVDTKSSGEKSEDPLAHAGKEMGSASPCAVDAMAQSGGKLAGTRTLTL